MRRRRGAAVRLRAAWSLILPVALVQSAAAQTPSLQDLAFMSGCWEGSFRSSDGRQGVIEEHYTSPSSNVMLGTTRYLLDGEAVQFELTTLTETEGVVTLHPYPAGQPSPARFRLTDVAVGQARFDAPEHDFPKRITYRRTGPGELLARVDDGTAERGTEWRLQRVACVGS